MRRKGSQRVFTIRERAAVLNLDDDQKLDEYLRKYGVVFENEAQFEYLKHCARVNTKGVFPKLKRESKLWLKSIGGNKWV